MVYAQSLFDRSIKFGSLGVIRGQVSENPDKMLVTMVSVNIISLPCYL